MSDLCSDLCPVCCGAKWVRRDLPAWDPEFARALPCPACTPVEPPVPLEERRPRLRRVV
jgi:hypothetical protein